MITQIELTLKKDPEERIVMEDKPLTTRSLISFEPLFKMYKKIYSKEYFEKHQGQVITKQANEEIESQARNLANEYLQDLEKEAQISNKIQKTACENADVLQTVLRLLNERHEFNETNQDILKNQPRNISIDYLLETFNIKLKIEEADETIWNFLGPGLTTCVYYYTYLRICCQQPLLLDNEILNDHFYDVLKKLKHDLKRHYKTPFTAIEVEHIQIMLNLLKPYLSNSYSEFYLKFVDREQVGGTKEIDYIGILDAELKMFKDQQTKLLKKIDEFKGYGFSAEYQNQYDEIAKFAREINLVVGDDLRKIKLDRIGNVKIWNPQFMLVRTIFKTMSEQLKLLNKINSVLEMTVEYCEKKKKQYMKLGLKNLSILLIFTQKNSPIPLEQISPQDKKEDKSSKERLQTQEKELEEQASKDLQAFKRIQEERLMAWREEYMQERALKEAIQQAREEELSIVKNQCKAHSIEQTLEAFEISQLICIHENIKNYIDILENLFAAKELTFKNLEKLIKATSKHLIVPEKFKDFNLIKFTGSSHFSAYIPNTHIKWSTQASENLYRLTPKQMSTLNSWDHSVESHNGGSMSMLAIKQARKGWIRSGITPERIKRAIAAREYSPSSFVPR